MEFLLASPVTMALLAANVAASLYAFNNQEFYEQNVFWIAPMREGNQWHRMLTSGFLHVGGFHLLINMYVLYGFGPTLEQVFGTTNFIILYMASLIGGSAWMYFDKKDTANYRAAGASGAISGLVLAVGVIAPFAELRFLGLIPIWAGVAGVAFIVISFVLSKRDNAIIAHGGHLGGAVAGLVMTLILLPDSYANLIKQVSARLG